MNEEELSEYITNHLYSYKGGLHQEQIEEITDYMLMSDDKNTETQTTKSTTENSITATETNPTNTKTEALERDKDTVCSTPPQVNEEQKKDGGIWKKCCCWFKNKFTKSSRQ